MASLAASAGRSSLPCCPAPDSPRPPAGAGPPVATWSCSGPPASSCSARVRSPTTCCWTRPGRSPSNQLQQDDAAAVQLLRHVAFLAADPLPVAVLADQEPTILPGPLHEVLADPVRRDRTLGALHRDAPGRSGA